MARLSRNAGFQVLGIWLIAAALIQFIPGLVGLGIILTALQLVAGLLILLGR
jgi:hypothetical protein